MTNIQGNIKVGRNKFIPNTTSDAVADVNKNQKLTKTLQDISTNISNKADKLGSGHTNNVATFNNNGNLKDSGVPVENLANKDTDAVAGNLAKFDSNGNPVDAGIAAESVAQKADKVSGATNGDLAALDINGNLKDSGYKPADFATAAQGAKADTAVQPADLEPYAKVEDLEDGSVVPALADNLKSWAEDVSEVSNSWDKTIRSTAGDDPIDTAFGGVLTDIVAKTDFECDMLDTSGYNLLRLASNGGVAVAVGNGWYFPVPRLELGAFGDATKNNGVLLTDKDGNNIKNATVYFKALANGVPTSVNDGVVATYQDVTYNDETFRTYLTSGPGYLIVSGITYADTCAHLAWEDWYNKYVSPTDADDAGDSIDLTALFAAAPNGTGKFLVLGSGGNAVATRATRTGSTQMTITDPIGRVTSPSWTNELQEDEETYKHSLAISGMKSDGLAQIEGSDQMLAVVGTTVSYTDTNETAISGTVRYEKATAATANVTLTKTQYALNDCGIEMKSGATGEAYFGCSYSQNVADALSQIAKVKLNISLSVVAEAIAELWYNLKGVKRNLQNYGYQMKVKSIDSADTPMVCGSPLVVEGAGAPSVVPMFVGQRYHDTANNKCYEAFYVTCSTNDWKILN